ncbi:MAG: hypothetical protein KGQ59_12605, partial [Bdellovibrionales bacterium]|nr:hypothetical protein [Bdellovibrionales bacterium]
SPASAGNDIPGIVSISTPSGESDEELMPRDTQGRFLWIFERRIMPFLYQGLLRWEWRTLLFASYFLLVALSLLFAVAPSLKEGDLLVQKELSRRARFMADLIVELNAENIISKAESRSDIPDSIAKAEGVTQAVLVDLDGRVIAPAARLNQYVTTGPAAKLVVLAREAFQNGQVKPIVTPGPKGVILAASPMFGYSQKEGKNIPLSMGLVAIDSRIARNGVGKETIIYAEAIIYLGFFALILALVIYRLTLKPLEIINNQIDRSLKGAHQEDFSRECKFEELSQLQDVIEALLRRSAAAQLAENQKESGTSNISIADECLHSFRLLGEQMSHGMAFCDAERRLLFMNSPLEEISGIRNDNSVMQNFPDQARDQAFSALLNDLFDRASASVDGATEEFEFSGVPHQIKMVGVGNRSGASRGYVLTVVRIDNG